VTPADPKDAAPRRGVRLGVDVGDVRVGVAASDPGGVAAVPVETVRRDSRSGTDLSRIAALADERDAVEVVVGLPRSLSGAEGPAAAGARDYAALLAARLAPLPVRLVDERLTTVTATRQLRSAGVSQRKGRAVVDQAAAAIILQSALDIERSTGRPAGQLVDPSGSTVSP
jgi:putative Holliday junction resolvase